MSTRAPRAERITRWLRDARLLGAGAALRLVYEASKRTGLHSVVFRARTPTSGSVDFRDPLRLGPGKGRPIAGAAGTSLRVFGRSYRPAEIANDWHQAFDAPASWPRSPWWEIDIRSAKRVGDVKWCWEANRPANLVRCFRHDVLNSEVGNGEAVRLLETWLEQNPPEHGVNWYSNLEVALRVVGWLELLAVAGDEIPEPLKDHLVAVLYHAGHHLERDLPYTLSTMRNNHLLGDALGLAAVGLSFPSDRAARRWRFLGRRLFEYQARRQFAPDGSSIEDSLSYHRFALEMLEMGVLIGLRSPPIVTRMVEASRFLIRLGVLDGPVPQYGDWDEGRVLTSNTDPLDVSGTALLGLALAGTGARPEWRADYDECAWYAQTGTPTEGDTSITDGSSIGGGIARAQRGNFVAWLKAGGGKSHGHADYTSLTLRHGSRWVIGDPGTGTYNGPIEQRNYFRCSIAHSVTRVNDLDQREPHRVFRWVYAPSGWVGSPVALADGVIMWGLHDAYTRLEPSRRVARAVLLQEAKVTTIDWVEGDDRATYAMSIPLGPDAEWEAGSVRLPDGVTLELDLPEEPTASHGQTAPFDGWWSATYGSIHPATRLEIRGRLGRPIVWSIREPSAARSTSIDGDTVTVGETRITVTWEISGATLTVDDGGRETVTPLHHR